MEEESPFRIIKFTFAGSPLRAQAEPVDHVHHNVLFITLIRSKFMDYVAKGLSLLPGILLRPLQRLLPPQFYLARRLVLKTLTPELDEVFDNEMVMYKRLEPLQGRIIPRFLGCAEFNGMASIVLSRLEGEPSYKQGPTPLPAEDFGRQLTNVLKEFIKFGVMYDDPKLDNFVVVKGKVMVVDLESVCEVEEKSYEIAVSSHHEHIMRMYKNNLECPW